MKFGVVVFPGSNCDQDMIDVLESMKAKYKNEVVRLWHKDHDLQGCDFIILPGGFSYGDYLRSGAIARFSPIMQEVCEFADKGGFVMGVCNGFQILCEAHLLPGALLHNNTRRFVCKNVFIKAISDEFIITSKLSTTKALKIPIAHGEGKFYADDNAMRDIYQHNQIVFKYCDANAVVTSDANPNGSMDCIAGISNRTKNVFGMMPHPERAADAALGNTDGLLIFQSIFNSIEVV
ncbi:MAG: phosphoribosylformylglycinamidine synthase subunit PurQ [Bacteroidetes bacterium]|nr:phosphoribosylformylglycinamidine synthase subunit PurQ [Bacteroidota bacterium]